MGQLKAYFLNEWSDEKVTDFKVNKAQHFR